jgi:hypothetical protein
MPARNKRLLELQRQRRVQSLEEWNEIIRQMLQDENTPDDVKDELVKRGIEEVQSVWNPSEFRTRACIPDSPVVDIQVIHTYGQILDSEEL